MAAPSAKPNYLSGQREPQSPRGELPEEVTGFIGRKAELEQIGALLGSARLITVFGPGGVGKTRVSLRAAAQSEHSFTDGVCLVELSGLRDPQLLPNTVARRLGLPEQSTRPALDAVLGYLRSARLLLILDTCEHIVDACAMLAEAILRETAAVTVLATSRQPLDVPGEHTYLVPPLPVPPQDDGPDGIIPVTDAGEALTAGGTVLAGTALGGTALGGTALAGNVLGGSVLAGNVLAGNVLAGTALAGITRTRTRRSRSTAPRSTVPRGALGGGDAVDLLAQRAAAAVPGFRVTAANRADTIRLCQRLDGIPLAIELAAVRLRALPLPELTRRLENRFEILAGGRRGAVPRHQTLRTATEWSYDLCSADEQALWARLSVFAGSFDLDAVAEVCTDPRTPCSQTVQTLTGLIDKSVVLRESADSTRYRLLDTLREFGAERLAAVDDTTAGGRSAIRGRLIGRYLRLARRFDEHFLDDEQMDMFHGMLREHASIRAALEYGLDAAPGGSEREREAADLCTTLQGYWVVSGLMAEGSYWLGKVIDHIRRLSPLRARAMMVRGRLKTFQGDIPGALADLREATAMAEELGEQRILAYTSMNLHLALTYAGDYHEAAAAGREAVRRLEETGDRAGRIYLQPQIAHLLVLSGQPQEAVECCAEGLRMLGEGSKERWIRSSTQLIASFALGLQPGREAECETMVREALRAKHELKDIVGIAYGLEALGWLAVRAGRHGRAAWLFGAAEPLWQRTGSRMSGVAIMEALHQAVVAELRGALGATRIAFLAAQGARQPLSLVVAQATGEAPEGADGGPGEGDGGDGPPGIAARLTAREREVASLIADGMSNRQVATSLLISKRTVDAHVEHIFGKLGISSRVHLTAWLGSRPRAAAAGQPREEFPQHRAP